MGSVGFAFRAAVPRCCVHGAPGLKCELDRRICGHLTSRSATGSSSCWNISRDCTASVMASVVVTASKGVILDERLNALDDQGIPQAVDPADVPLIVIDVDVLSRHDGMTG